MQLESLQQHELQLKQRSEEQVSLAQQHAAKLESQHQEQHQRQKVSDQYQQQQQQQQQQQLGHSFEEQDQHHQHQNLHEQHNGLEQEQHPDLHQRLEHEQQHQQQQQQPDLEQPRPQEGATEPHQQQNAAGGAVAPDSAAGLTPLGISPAAMHSGDLQAAQGDRPSVQQHCTVEAAQSDLFSLHSAMAAAQVSARAATAAAAAAAVVIPPPTSWALQLPRSFDPSSSGNENQVRARHQRQQRVTLLQTLNGERWLLAIMVSCNKLTSTASNQKRMSQFHFASTRGTNTASFGVAEKAKRACTCDIPGLIYSCLQVQQPAQLRSSLSQSALHTAPPTPHPHKKLLKVHSGSSGPAMAAATGIWYPADTTNLRVSAKLESATPSTLPPGLTDDLAAALQAPDAAVHLQVRTAPALK